MSLAQAAGSTLQVIDAIGIDAEDAVGTSVAMGQVPGPVVDGLAAPRALGGRRRAARSTWAARPTAPTASVSLLVVPLAAQNDLSGAMIVTTRRPIPATLRQSIETLASTVSLALESATLTENLPAPAQRAAVPGPGRELVRHRPGGQRRPADHLRQPGGHRLLGLPEKTLVGSHPARWVHPDDWPTLARVLDGQPVETAERRRRGRGPHPPRRRQPPLVRDPHQGPAPRPRDRGPGGQPPARSPTARPPSCSWPPARPGSGRWSRTPPTSWRWSTRQGRYTYVSPAVTEMLGFTPEELEGTQAVGILAPEELTTFRANYPELSQPVLPTGELQVRRFEAQVLHRSGECRTLDVAVTDLRHEPAVAGIVLNARDITVRKELEHDLRYQALHDTLTGLANRTMFTQEAAAALRTAEPAPAVGRARSFIDLDDFKTVNDSLGHAVGDQLLQEVGRAARSPTSRRRDLAARLGGDEFAVLVVDGDGEHGVAGGGRPGHRPGGRAVPHPGPRDPGHLPASASPWPPTTTSTPRCCCATPTWPCTWPRSGARTGPSMFEDHIHTSVFERLELKADLVRAIEDGQLRCSLPADRVAPDRPHHRRRGPRALGPPRPGPALARRLHPPRRGHRPHRAARPVGAARGVPAAPGLAAPACPPTSSLT